MTSKKTVRLLWRLLILFGIAPTLLFVLIFRLDLLWRTVQGLTLVILFLVVVDYYSDRDFDLPIKQVSWEQLVGLWKRLYGKIRKGEKS